MDSQQTPVVMVSGCFDLLHSGHLAFFEAAAAFGRLVVAVGSDSTVTALKGRAPWCSQAERLYLVRALRVVEEAFISQGSGILDFEQELRSLQPQRFIVNEDGDHPAKRQLCDSLGIEYIVLPRSPAEGLPSRSSTGVREHLGLPYRIEISGGWLDQPIVSQLCAGPVIVASIDPQPDFARRSGLATSSRDAAQRFWGHKLPPGDPQQLARQLFALENPPGTIEVAGSQDQLGLLLPGVSRLSYRGQYWPENVESIVEESALQWLENVLFLIPLEPRPPEFRVRAGEHIHEAAAVELAHAAEETWEAIRQRDAQRLGRSLTHCLSAQLALFPAMLPSALKETVASMQRSTHGAKFTGAGGGGYLVAAASTPPPNAVRVQIRRPADASY